MTAESGAVDLLVNNAGLGHVCEFDSDNLKSALSMIDLNCRALTQLSHFFSRKMIENGGGTILNVASVAAFAPIPYFSVYAATKSYVLSLSHALNIELADKGVRVKCLCPGPVDTDFSLIAGVRPSVIRRMSIMYMSSDRLAEQAWKLINSRCSISTPGFSNFIARAIAKIAPVWVLARINGIIYKRVALTK